MTSHSQRWVMTMVLLLVLLAGSVAGNFWLTGRELAASNARWCDTLVLLTSHPVQKPASAREFPVREQQYRFYENFVKLRSEFGCR